MSLSFRRSDIFRLYCRVRVANTAKAIVVDIVDVVDVIDVADVADVADAAVVTELAFESAFALLPIAFTLPVLFYARSPFVRADQLSILPEQNQSCQLSSYPEGRLQSLKFGAISENFGENYAEICSIL